MGSKLRVWGCREHLDFRDRDKKEGAGNRCWQIGNSSEQDIEENKDCEANKQRTRFREGTVNGKQRKCSNEET